jgi:hydroxypyruvate isomerase
MPRFAANLSMMYPEFELRERFVAAHNDGFAAVEFLQPYGESITDLASWLGDNALELILVNTPMGDVRNGDRGLAGLPDRESEFRAAFELSLSYAVELNIPMIHVMAGVVPEGVPRQACAEVLVKNLQQAAAEADRHNIRLMLEPLSNVDVPGYLYSRADEARVLIDSIDRSNVQLQYDFYHLQVTAGNLAAGLQAHFDVIGHIQFSSVPGRHEPQYGEVNLPFLFNLLDEIGYTGWVGCEYRPKASTAAGLTWALPYGLGPG